ncbi:MAG TPA: hypothetical protein DCS43_06515 [Verrucomicrobia bacterium]|nr:hypothetical protein [Verrucomicrobiota bacterium]
MSARTLHRLPPDPELPYDGMPVTEEAYWEHYYLGHDVTYEWNNGVLEEKGVSNYATFLVFDWFIQLLTEFLRTQPIADRVGLEMGFRLALPGKTVIRRPDYGVVHHDNPIPLTGSEQSYRGIFDLCIEGVSTSSKVEQERDTVVKKGEYAAGGVQEYYLLHETVALRQFYRRTARGVYAPLPVGPGRIVHSEVLPGFRWRLDDLERRPPLETLIADPVYQDFVWVNYQQERNRADQAQAQVVHERLRADQAQAQVIHERLCVEQVQAQVVHERLRAEQERTRAEQLAARLRQLGIDPDAAIAD